MVVVVSKKDELKKALIDKEEEILVTNGELAENIGEFIERLRCKNESEFETRVYITGLSLFLGTALLSNFLAFGFLIVGFKVLIIPELLIFIAILVLLAMKLNNLLKNNYEIVDSDEEGLFLRYKLS
ncbi:MAG: hypothetical protein AAF915_27480 [Cyanobacteria bacterium P01_D01_bin.50]